MPMDQNLMDDQLPRAVGKRLAAQEKRLPAAASAKQIPLSQERLLLALRSAGIGAWETDLQTGDNTWDAGVAELVGIPIGQEGDEGKRWTEYIHPEDRKAVLASFRRAGEQGIPWSEDFRVLREDGVIRWFNARSIVATVQEGRRKMVGVVQDITARKQAEAALALTAEKFEKAFHGNASAMVLTHVKDGLVVDANQAWLDQTGFSRAEVIGKTADEHGGWKDSVERATMVAELKAQGRIQNRECRCRKKSGEEYMVLLNSQPIMIQGESLLLSSSIDITERKQVEDALKESGARLQILAHAGRIGFVEWNATKDTSYWSPEHYDIFGFEPDQQVSYEQWLQGVHPQDRSRVAQSAARLLERGRTEGHVRDHKDEYRFIRPDGSMIWIGALMSAEVVAGEMIIRGSVHDITERKQSEAALASVHQQLQSIINKMPAIVYAFDLEERFVMANAAVAELFHSTPEQILGKRRHAFMPKADADWHEANDRKVIEAGKTLEFEEHSELPGRSITWLTTKFPLHDAQGRIYAVAGISKDISERKQTQEALVRLNETLEEKVQERTVLAETRASQLRFLAVELIEAEERERRYFAHLLHEDLQQLLAAAKMQVHAAAATSSDEPVLSYIASILEESIAKTRHLSHELSPPVLHQAGLISALKWLSRHMHEKFGLETELKVNTELLLERTPQKVFLFRAVQELLFNTVKHAGVKSAKVEVSSTEDSIIVSVSDQGCGFNPEVLSQRGVKVGFGLLTIKERASYIEGKFTIECAPGQGSRFTLTVPNAAANGFGEAVTDEQVVEEVQLPHAKEMKSTAKGISVLFVDDHKVMRQGLMKLVSGMPAIRIAGEASDGREALEQACKLSPDVILMDISMPEMDGIEATRCIKAKLPEVRVIGLTMHQDEVLIEAMKKAGAEVTLSKTTSASELIKTILVGTTSCD